MATPPTLLRLEQSEVTSAVAGGKAAHLGVMLRAGLPVPAGFVITTLAYRAFVSRNGLGPVIRRHWESLDPAAPASFDTAAAALQEAFAHAVLPAELAGEIRAAHIALVGDHAVAVRSSATAEDLPTASFAGQQDTYLNIRGERALLVSVQRCWGSLWTSRAMAYRLRQGIGPTQVALAVVVQEMAPAAAAGVLFTVHPVSGDTSQVVINATWGLGEALVAGRINPDSLSVEKRSGRILQSHLGDKRIMSVPSAEGGTREVAVDPRQRQQPCLTTEQVGALVRLGCRLEELFGQPQDVEWAIAADRVVLLQSRPVTTAAATNDVPGDDAWSDADDGEPQPFDFWTQQDLGERWPDPVTPLTWSIFQPLTQASMDELIPPVAGAGRIRWCRRAFGHAYLNEGALLHAYVHGLGLPLAWVRSGLTHPGALPGGSGGWQPRKVLRHLPWFLEAALAWERRVNRFEAEFPAIDRAVDEFLRQDRRAASDQDLIREARATWIRRIAIYITPHTHATSLAMGAMTQVENLLTKWLGDAALAPLLASGVTGVIAAEMPPALRELAALLRAAGLAERFAALPPAAALAGLRTDPAARPFLARLEVFLQRHGHRCVSEAELLHPRWLEAPEQVLETLAGYLRCEQRPDVAADAAARARAAAVAQVESRLRGWQRRLFQPALRRLHRFTQLRDNGQNYLIRLLLPLRIVLAELGGRWARRGWLAESTDVFFLTEREMAAVAEAGDPTLAGLDLASLARQRRAAHAHWSRRRNPEPLDARGQPVVRTVSGGRILEGIAASPGEVSGPARIVLTPAEIRRLAPGDILVTRATDPGWTPAFTLVRGLVLEIGGTLSHGAIVAREYGLPAVVNVAQATERIRDGQWITVSGTVGRVRVEERPVVGTNAA